MEPFVLNQWQHDFYAVTQKEKQEQSGRKVRYFENWYEFGSFVDAMISVGTSIGGKVSISLGCNNEELMFVIQQFLARHGLPAADGTISVREKCVNFKIYQLEAVIDFARRLLPYVSQCHRHLVVILQHAKTSISQERTQAILALNGNKTKFCRNSTEAMNVTRKLNYLKAKTTKMERDMDAENIMELTYKRALLQQEHQSSVLAAHIREILANGAEIRKQATR